MSRMPMPFSNPRTYPGHSGVDFPQPRGTPIRASGPGVVLRIRWTLAGGWWTTIRYDNGTTFGYAHQDRKPTVVKVGQRVVEGSVIGHVGKRGLRSTGYHLHLTDVNNQTYAATIALLDTSRVVGAPRPAATNSKEYPDMFIAIVRNKDWYLVVGGKACLLGAASNARNSGAPILEFVDDWAVKQLQSIVTGIR
ncbi:MAG TPA: M23 family metallopeptidase [Terrimesophilobacter sp.]|nr:M23 family metallopeptidase [Terrimesophilobacter sp.]